MSAAHAAFFAGEAALSNGVYYLALPDGTPFGYYSYIDADFIYHFDLGYEFVYDPKDGSGSVYFYDFASGHWWYTSRSFAFPYLYDFTFKTVLFYFPDTNSPGRYTNDPRYFANTATKQIFPMGRPISAGACADQFMAGNLIGGYYPCDLTAAYRLPAGGAEGTGAIVIVVDAYDNPNAESDLAVYRAKFGLGTCSTSNHCFRKLNQRGIQGGYPQAAPVDANHLGWGLEISLDLDMVSAICPNCKITLAEADSGAAHDLADTMIAANSVAAATAISASYGCCANPDGTGKFEPLDESTLDLQYSLATVTAQQPSDVEKIDGGGSNVTFLVPQVGSIGSVQLSLSSTPPQDITFGITCTTEIERAHPCPGDGSAGFGSPVTVGSKAHYTWILPTPVVMNPNQYYWISESHRTGGFYELWGDSNATPTYSFHAGWDHAYYVVGSATRMSATAVVAATGDFGYGVQYPAASPYVIAVGGTTLLRGANSRGWTETAWGVDATHGTGSGCSAYEPKPAWQTDTGCAKRMVADVAAIADPNPGVAVYDTYGGAAGWLVAGGTSASAPIVAGIYGLVNQPTSHGAQSIYTHKSHLNDVTTGSNGTCAYSYFCIAVAGYDGPTGNGTPNGLLPFGSLGDATVRRNLQSIVPTGSQRRLTSGQSEPVCGPAKPGHARCFAWVRTDIGRTQRKPMTMTSR